MKIPVQLVRSDRKTLCLQITNDGVVRLRMPRHTPQAVWQAFIAQKQPWIDKQLARQRARQQACPPRVTLTKKDLHALAQQACTKPCTAFCSLAWRNGGAYHHTQSKNTVGQL